MRVSAAWVHILRRSYLFPQVRYSTTYTAPHFHCPTSEVNNDFVSVFSYHSDKTTAALSPGHVGRERKYLRFEARDAILFLTVRKQRERGGDGNMNSRPDEAQGGCEDLTEHSERLHQSLLSVWTSHCRCSTSFFTSTHLSVHPLSTSRHFKYVLHSYVTSTQLFAAFVRLFTEVQVLKLLKSVLCRYKHACKCVFLD